MALLFIKFILWLAQLLKLLVQSVKPNQKLKKYLSKLELKIDPFLEVLANLILSTHRVFKPARA